MSGIEGNPLYTHDVGVVLLQGMSNDIYGSVVAGSDVELKEVHLALTVIQE